MTATALERTDLSNAPATSGKAGLRARFSAKTPRGVLGFTMFFTGVSSLVFQYVFGTVFTFLLGNSIEQFSVTIGLMFLAMGTGTILQKYLVRDNLAETFLGIELLLVLTGGFAPVVLQWAYATMPNDFTAVKWLYAIVTGIAIGMEIPLIMRINEQFSANLGTNISETWTMDYLGGAAGTVLWIYVLRSGAPITQISFGFAACNLAVAVVCLIFFWRRGLLRRWVGVTAAVLTIIVTAGLLVGVTQANTWSRLMFQQLYDDPIEATFNTKYQNITLTKGPHPTDPGNANFTLWLNGNKQFSSLDESIYHELLVHPVMNLAARRERVLILGGGDGLALREVLKYTDVRDVTLADLDPGMIDFARTNPVMRKLNQDSLRDARVTDNFTKPALRAGVNDTGKQRAVKVETGEHNVECEEVVQGDQRVSSCVTKPETEHLADVNVYTVDADKFVEAQPGPWDVVIIDLPDPNSVELAKLYSVEFYRKVKAVLSPDGLVVVQSTSPFHAKETFLCIQRTMSAAGLNTVPYHENVPSFGDWGWMMASPSLPQSKLHTRASELKRFDVPTTAIDANGLHRALIFPIDWLKSLNTEISTTMRPVVFNYYEYYGWVVE